ncbi:excinuclease ABC subunit UvrB [Candidatus Gottesmanbacteria bacterium]|nr:excinuclease ABC subunit UvrB [Candidatus Gottesmanbacteria bacterium]
MQFQLKSPFKPTGDQPQAIKKLSRGLAKGFPHQVLLGVTGSGKTYTIANVIEKVQKPTLIISHNKTLAAQLYQEFRDFFPNNSVCYFVSYYDFYQPEAYIPQTDTYIEKVTEINEEIDKLRLSATANLLTRRDVIVVASVSCIYNIGSPEGFGQFVLEAKTGMKISRDSIIKRLVDLQYMRSLYQFKRGTFRIRGEAIDIYPAYEDTAIRITIPEDRIENIKRLDVLDGSVLQKEEKIFVYPAKHFISDQTKQTEIFARIRIELSLRLKQLKSEGKELEAHRLAKKVNYDLEMIAETGYVNGIENYSRYFDGRKPGEAPYTLLDYYRQPYGNDWLLVIDESHMTIPQIRGMYNGDRSRKQTLIDFGFRLPSALDNRPLTFVEFMQRTLQTIYVSATPDEWEMTLAKKSVAKVILSDPELVEGKSKDLSRMRARTSREIPRQVRDDNNAIVEQLVRPTGITDPKISIRPTIGQIEDLVKEIIARKKKGERVLVTTLTKRMAEDLSVYLNEKKYLNVHYLHSDVETLERSDILDDLRGGKYDVLIGINLLREGLDLPEVSLVAILDADKEGFLRSTTSLVQTMGRAARHIKGSVVMYADKITASMKKAIGEIERRRRVQIRYNKKHHWEPRNIVKPIREKLVIKKEDKNIFNFLDERKRVKYRDLLQIDSNQLTPLDKGRLIKKLAREMRNAADILNFELAAEIRDKIREIGTN